MIDRQRVNAVLDVPDAIAGVEPEVGMLDEARAIRLSEPLLSIGDVAVLLGISVAAARRIPPGELPFSRVTARNDRRYEKSDVVRYVDSRRVSS